MAEKNQSANEKTAKVVEQCFNPAREKYIRKVEGSKVYPATETKILYREIIR